MGRGYKLTISAPQLGLVANVKYHNLSKEVSLGVEARVGTTVVKERLVFQGQVLGPGATHKEWQDSEGRVYAREDVMYYYEGARVSMKEMTKVFEVKEFQPIRRYTDDYIISKYYEVYPSDNGSRRAEGAAAAERVNLSGMRTLWAYLHANQVVARGEMNVSSKGFLGGDGFIRAVSVDSNKWALELGIFAQAKVFEHVNEIQAVQVSAPLPRAHGIRLL